MVPFALLHFLTFVFLPLFLTLLHIITCKKADKHKNLPKQSSTTNKIKVESKTKPKNDGSTVSGSGSGSGDWEFIEMEWYPDQEDLEVNPNSIADKNKSQKSTVKTRRIKQLKRGASVKEMVPCYNTNYDTINAFEDELKDDPGPFNPNPQYETMDNLDIEQEKQRKAARVFEEKPQMGPAGKGRGKVAENQKVVDAHAPAYQTLADFNSKILDDDPKGKDQRPKEVDAMNPNYQTLANLNSAILDEKERNKSQRNREKPKEADPFAPNYQTLADFKTEILDAPKFKI